MIAADTSTWIAFLQGGGGEDTAQLDAALLDRRVAMVPVVLSELLSAPDLPLGAGVALAEVPMLELMPGYWQRAGLLRAKVLAQGRKARLGDALIAQCCLDHGLLLLTRDRDFLNFAAAGGLRIAFPQ